MNAPTDNNQRHVYTVSLDKIPFGRPFMMLNYPGIYIRIKNIENYGLVRNCAMGRMEFPFNDDGHHVPIVSLETGDMMYMSKVKPCMVYPGEHLK